MRTSAINEATALWGSHKQEEMFTSYISENKVLHIAASFTFNLLSIKHRFVETRHSALWSFIPTCLTQMLCTLWYKSFPFSLPALAEWINNYVYDFHFLISFPCNKTHIFKF